jgi:hypothetical protein
MFVHNMRLAMLVRTKATSQVLQLLQVSIWMAERFTQGKESIQIIEPIAMIFVVPELHMPSEQLGGP